MGNPLKRVTVTMKDAAQMLLDALDNVDMEFKDADTHTKFDRVRNLVQKALKVDGTCATCKHWEKRGEGESGHNLGLGKCGNAPMFWDATRWDDAGESREFKDEYKDVKAFVQDGSDYRAELLTRPAFGCLSYDEVDPEEGKCVRA